MDKTHTQTHYFDHFLQNVNIELPWLDEPIQSLLIVILGIEKTTQAENAIRSSPWRLIFHPIHPNKKDDILRPRFHHGIHTLFT
jgi:hypothetical protein